MRAIRVDEFGPPGVMKIQDVARPQPGAGEVLVRVYAAGVNPVDTYIRSGAYAVRPELPYTPGTDAAGIVEAVGSCATEVVAGDRVYCSGTRTGAYAEYAVATPDQVHALPENVSFDQGAAVNIPYATAYRALFQRAHALPGECVLVHGASGGVGIAAVQLAVAHGLRAIGTAGTGAGRRLVLEQGAVACLDHTQPGYLDEAAALAGGSGVHVILEMLANVNLGQDLRALARGGRVVVVGSRGPVEINPRDAMARDAAILGMVLFNASPSEKASIHAALQAGLRNGSLRPVVREGLPLEEAPRAHELVMQPGAFGKLVLRPTATSGPGARG